MHRIKLRDCWLGAAIVTLISFALYRSATAPLSQKVRLSWQPRTLIVQTDWPKCMFSDDGRTLTVRGRLKDNSNEYHAPVVQTWDIATSRLIKQWVSPHPHPPCLICSPDGTAEAQTTSSGDIELWNITTGKLQNTLFTPQRTDQDYLLTNHDVSWSHHVLAAVHLFYLQSQQSTLPWWTINSHVKPLRAMLILYEWPSGKVKHLLLPKVGTSNTEEDFPWYLRFSPDGTRLLTVNLVANKQTLSRSLWDVDTGALLWKSEQSDGIPGAYEFSEDGRLLAESNGNVIHLWELATGHVRYAWQVDAKALHFLAFSPDSKRLAYGDNVGRRIGDAIVQVRDTQSGQLISTWHTPSSSVDALMFSPDNSSLAVAGYKSVTVWDVRAGKLQRTVEGTEGQVGVDTLMYSKDGSMLATGSFDGTVRLWRIH
ncbi:MAG: hypothetical protein JO316_04500 [Abitibacteriaceae bacterium]|nr:hypothetical protein [Abditibacteriaceae bacterium]